ncbi:MAG: hypothetical protein HKM97_13635 [Acidimicrobiia bacterium]|nr:hypothetical protein [Acidimicrobiia bacterium]
MRISGEPTNVVWLTDGNILVTTGSGDAFVIDAKADLINLAREAVGRQLSDRECDLYLGTSCEEWEARVG